MAGIRIEVRAGGIEIKGVGYAGPRCENAVKYVSDLLNGEVLEQEHTPEFFQTPDQEVEQ